ncbi:MAG: hypothetical protein ACP5OC_04455 [Thermoplasmata archaeon]
MKRVGIYTHNFRFYHEVVNVLKSWRIKSVSIDDIDHLPSDVSIILSSNKDEKIREQQIRTDSAIEAVRVAVPFLLGKEKFRTLIIGIDPGPKPGIAVLGDDILLEAFEAPSIDSLMRSIRTIAAGYRYSSYTVRIGHGDIPNRDTIILKLKGAGMTPDIVDETNTSQPHKIHDNAVSAARIARGSTSFPDPKIQNYRRRDILELEFVTLQKAITA